MKKTDKKLEKKVTKKTVATPSKVPVKKATKSPKKPENKLKKIGGSVHGWTFNDYETSMAAATARMWKIIWVKEVKFTITKHVKWSWCHVEIPSNIEPNDISMILKALLSAVKENLLD